MADKIVFTVGGGIIQDITADGDIECLIIDMDTDGVDENRISRLHIFNERGKVKACTVYLDPVINPEFVEHYFKQAGDE